MNLYVSLLSRTWEAILGTQLAGHIELHELHWLHEFRIHRLLVFSLAWNLYNREIIDDDGPNFRSRSATFLFETFIKTVASSRWLFGRRGAPHFINLIDKNSGG